MYVYIFFIVYVRGLHTVGASHSHTHSLSWSLVDAHLRHEHAAFAEVVRSQGPALAATAKAVKAGKHPATALAQYHAGAVFV